MKILKQKNMTPEEKTVKKILASSADTIKSINLDKTRFMLDINYRGKGFIDNTSWHREIVAQYNFFITIVGLLEAKIIDLSRKATLETDTEKINKISSVIDNLTKKRQKIINTYLEQESDYDLPVVKKILTQSFIFYQLEELYKDLELNNYRYKLHHEFIEAYNNGSKLADKCNLKKVMIIYDQLYLQCLSFKAKNERIIVKTGNAKTLKKIASDEHFASKNRD